MVTHPAPPQTRTCAINAYGSSGKAFCYPLPQCNGGLVTRLVSTKSLSCVGPLNALPDVAFPPVGRLGLTSPPSAVLCDATTATCPSRVASLVARFPIPCVLLAFVVSPQGSLSGRSAQTAPRPLVTRSPNPGMSSRRQMALPRSRVPPVKTCLALRPRWCPAHSPSRTQDCCLPAHASDGLPRLYTFRGSITRPTFSLPPAPYRPLTGRHRGFATDRLARLLVRWDLNLTVLTPLGNNNQFHGVTSSSKVSGLPLARACPC